MCIFIELSTGKEWNEVARCFVLFPELRRITGRYVIQKGMDVGFFRIEDVSVDA